MGAPRIGTRVVEGTRVGVVVDHRPQGMVDVCFEDSGITERRPEGQLLTMNPAVALRVTKGADGGWYMAGTRYATQTAATKALSRAFASQRAAPVAPKPRAVREVAPAETRVADVYDPTQEQFRAVVQGVYESLVTKELGVASFKDARGLRCDEKALKRGTVEQADLRKTLSRAYAIATRQGQKYGYLEAGTQRPTAKGAALAAARYGADPKLVAKMLPGDTKAQKLAAKKDAEKLAENRQDYEITLRLVRKDQTPRVVEEIVGGKLVSFQQPGAKRVSRKKNGETWEERGMARTVKSLPLRVLPLADEARALGMSKGEILRALGLAKTPAAKGPLLRGLDDTEHAFRKKVADRVADLLGDDAYDTSGRATSTLRLSVGVLRKVYEDTADAVQRGTMLTNPIQSRIRHIAKVGDGYTWGDIKTSKKEFTPVVLSATPPALDPEGVGFFMITFDSRRRDVERALREATGWRVLPQVTSVGYEVGVATEAPKIHKVVRYTEGGASGKRAASGQFGKGMYSVVGPKSRGERFERKADAEEYARGLDFRAASFQVPQVHEVWRVKGGFEVRGPRAEEEAQKRLDLGWEGVDASGRLVLDSEGEAQRTAEGLDYKEASRGAMPIKGYRTAPGISGAKAVETYNKTLVALDNNRIFFTLDPSAKAMEKPTASVERRFRQVAVDPPGVRLMERFSVADVQSKPDTLFAFGDNMEREGKGGQAIIRDEKNAVGIPTKWRPSKDEEAYFADDDFPMVKEEIDAAFAVLEGHLRTGGAVVLPKDGIGTGLADLPNRAPKIYKYIAKKLSALGKIKPAVGSSRFSGTRVITVPDATSSARQKRLSERSPERLVATAVARGEDVDVLLPLLAEAEERGFKKLVNLLSKSYEEEATKNATKAAAKKLGAVGVAKVLSAPRDETSMKARMPGGFVQSARMFGAQRRVGFKKQASDLDVLLAALYPMGDVPPTLLPKYDRDHLRDLDEEALTKLAKSRLGMSDTDIRKVLTSVERSVLSKIVAEQASASGVGLIERGGFDVAVPAKIRKRLEAQTPTRRTLPKPLREEAVREAAQKSRVEDRMAELDREIAELQTQIAARSRKKNGVASTGLRLARSGGEVAARYGRRAYTAAHAWLGTAAGQKLVGEVSGVAIALFGAKAVSGGKLTKEQAALVQQELERKTGRKADPAKVAVALQLAGE